MPAEQLPELPNPSSFEPKRSNVGIVPPFLRGVFLVGGGVGLVLLVIAFRLTPNPAGLGTHQQLGFPQCTIIELFGIPCPSCGMTTSWSFLMHGQIQDAFRANPGGALLGLATLLGTPWMVLTGIAGRWWLGKPPWLWIFWSTMTIAATTTIHWFVRVVFFPL